jgi:hypothetical protein
MYLNLTETDSIFKVWPNRQSGFHGVYGGLRNLMSASFYVWINEGALSKIKETGITLGSVLNLDKL